MDTEKDPIIEGITEVIKLAIKQEISGNVSLKAEKKS